MNYLDFKKKLLDEEKITPVEYSNEDLPYQIAYMLKKARVVKGLTQVELAEKVGTKQESIARLEKGNKLPSLSFLTKIADALNSKLIMPVFDFLAYDSDLDFYNIRHENSFTSFASPRGENVKKDKFQSYNGNKTYAYSYTSY